jgi:hypothetical protein
MAFPTRSVARRALLAVTAIAAAVGALGTAAPAHAAETWAVQPGGAGGPDGRTQFDFEVQPGSTVSDLVSITNQSADAVLFNVYAVDGINDYEGGGFSVVSSPADNLDLGRWISVSDDAAVGCPDGAQPGPMVCLIEDGVVHLELPGNSRAEVPFTIAVPSNATPGDHTAGIMAAVHKAETGADGQAVLVEQRVGTRVHLRVAGELAPAMEASGLVTEYDGGWNPFSGTARVDYAVTNDGNLRMDTAQVVTVTGPFGIELARQEIPPVTDLLPGQSVHVTAELPGVAPLFLATATVELVPTTSTGEPIASVLASASTWAVPWSLVLGLVALAAGAWLLVRWRLHRARRLAATFDLIAQQARDEALAAALRSPAPAHTSGATAPEGANGAVPAREELSR